MQRRRSATSSGVRCRAASSAISSSRASRTAMASLTVRPAVGHRQQRAAQPYHRADGRHEQAAAAAGADLDGAALGEQPGGLADGGAAVARLLAELFHGRDALAGLQPALDDRLLDLGRELLGASGRLGKHSGQFSGRFP